jgi:5-oxopent-3-ene-1,2,5-tricarboxylate decarboxylase/2-hydroxyhepta-2,4-diene-1,7-dioate isomerase
MVPAVPPRASKVIGVHLNYPSRAAERGRVPEFPSYFFKPPSSLAGDGQLVRPRGTQLLGCEGEIAVVVSREARNISPEEAHAHIGWVAPANDAGVADFRWADRGSAVMSKGQDGFTPIGSAIPIESIDAERLVLRTLLNGEVVQEDTASNLIFDFALLVADLSRFMTLAPGDIILTGTPAGACSASPGDVVEVDLAGLSRVRSVVVDADAPLPSYGAYPKVTAEARAFAGVEPSRPPRLSPEAEAALRCVSVATLTVQLTRHGIRDSCVRGLRSTRPDLRLLGYARTLRYVPVREDVRDEDRAELNAQKAAIESLGPGEVLVIDARGEPNAGTIGDILAARAAFRGAAGIVTDGGIRDSAALANLDIPTYFVQPHAAVLGLVHYPLESDVPIACGGALVMPGDVVVGDADGVIVIPAKLAEDVAMGALEQERREQWALERVRAGESVRGLYPLSDARRPDYEAWRAGRGGD